LERIKTLLGAFQRIWEQQDAFKRSRANFSGLARIGAHENTLERTEDHCRSFERTEAHLSPLKRIWAHCDAWKCTGLIVFLKAQLRAVTRIGACGFGRCLELAEKFVVKL
jgi:hypothetical protein